MASRNLPRDHIFELAALAIAGIDQHRERMIQRERSRIFSDLSLAAAIRDRGWIHRLLRKPDHIVTDADVDAAMNERRLSSLRFGESILNECMDFNKNLYEKFKAIATLSADNWDELEETRCIEVSEGEYDLLIHWSKMVK